VKPTGTRPAHDPEATGPRDWTELAALRAAHMTMRHSALRAILDAQRIAALSHRPIVTIAAYRALPDRYRDAHEAYRAHRVAARTPNANPDRLRELRADAVQTALRARAALRAARAAALDERRPWPVAPCAAPRCTGHATVTDAGALRAEARHLHPIDARRLAAAA